VNASWVAVQELVQIGGLGDDINLVTLEIPVAYDDVAVCVPDIWKTYQPKVATCELSVWICFVKLSRFCLLTYQLLNCP